MLRSIICGLFACFCVAAQQHYAVSGLVIEVDAPSKTITVSHGAIAGYMDAMTMAFHADAWPRGLKRGDAVTFTLSVEKRTSSIGGIKVVEFDSAERDPVAATRLRLLDDAMSKTAAPGVAAGTRVPDFTLTDQNNRPVSLSQFAGKVVALDFVYTRCPLPDYCFRLSSNFARLQKRFTGNRDLILLTVTFDPVHDTPKLLADYAKIWHADPSMWYFLTGHVKDVQQVCSLFGVAYWQDDGLFTHTLHTAVIDRRGDLAANMEGNKFTAQQLGDLVDRLLRK